MAHELADGALVHAAAHMVAQWHRAWERRVDELRREKPIREHMALSHVHRTGIELMRAICTKHSTFSIFLSVPLDGLQRWQAWMILVSILMSQLLTNIWMCVHARAAAAARFARPL